MKEYVYAFTIVAVLIGGVLWDQHWSASAQACFDRGGTYFDVIGRGCWKPCSPDRQPDVHHACEVN